MAVLSLCLLIPLRRCGVRLRPVWRFPDTSARQAARLGAAGAVTVGTQQLALLTALILAYDAADNLFAPYLAVQAVYLLPWAVLAVPVATAAYPGLAAAHAAGDRAAFGAQVARTTRWVLLLSCLGAAALVAIAGPAAVVLNDPRDAALLVCLAPGLLGYGLFALLSRVLYARHEARAAAVAVALGWAVVIVASIGLAAALPVDRRLPGIAAGNSIGMLVLGVLLLLAVRRRAGAAAIDGAGRAAAVGLLAAVVAGAAGWAAVAGLDGPLDRLPNTAAAVVQVMAGGLVVLVGFIAVMWPLGRRDLEPTVAALRRRLRRRLRRGGPSTDTRPDESGTRADESGGAVGVPSGSAPSDGGAAGAGGPVGAAAGSADRAGPAATAAGAARSATTAVDDGGTTGLPGGQAGGAADGAAGGPAGGAAGGPVGGAAGGAAGGPVGGTAAGSVAENATSGRMSADGGRQRDEDVEGDG